MELVDRFGDTSAINAREAMHSTRQTGTLEDYFALFEERVAQLTSLPPAQYLEMFLGGLSCSIRDRIPDNEMTDVFADIRAARRIAHSQKPPSFHSSFSTNQSFHSWEVPVPAKHPSSSQSLSTPAFSQPSNSVTAAAKSGRGTRRMSEEAREYKAKRLCYRCSQPCGPLHKCSAKYLTILEADDDIVDVADEVEEQPASVSPLDAAVISIFETQAVNLSKLSYNGFDGATTMKLFSRLGDTRLLTMIDSGASHYFLADSVARKLGLPIDL